MEQVRHVFSSPGAYWINNSCEDVANHLVLGGILQAILASLFVFLLPASGSICPRRISPVHRPSLTGTLATSAPGIYRGVSREAVLTVSAGSLCAIVVAIAWWYGLRAYAGRRGLCSDLFDLTRSKPFHVDYLSDCSHYFIYLSTFSAFWIGIIAGGLRLQSDRAAESGSGTDELREFRTFYWVCFLGWAVQYRLSQWFVLGANTHAQQWSAFAILNFLFVTASSFWVLAFVPSWWKHKPRSWLHAVFQAFWRSLVILLLTLITFFWLTWMAFGVLIPPLATWDVFGLAWSLVVGTWRWSALQEQRLTSIVNV
jgi:hypothetical protein